MFRCTGLLFGLLVFAFCTCPAACLAPPSQAALNDALLNTLSQRFSKEQDRFAALQKLLEQGADINARNKRGETLLMQLASFFSPDSIAFLLRHGANPNLCDPNGRNSLIHTAAWVQSDLVYGGREEQCATNVETLIEGGANIDAQDNQGMTALMYAIANRHFPVFQTLLANGANVNLRDKLGRTALTWSTEVRDFFSGFSATWKYATPLLAKGAQVSTMDALLLGDVRKARALIARNVDLNQCGPYYDEPLLMAAAEKQSVAIVEALLRKGVDVNAEDNEGMTALSVAIAGHQTHWIPGGKYEWSGRKRTAKRVRIVEMLLAAGADVQVRMKDFSRDAVGDTALDIAVEVGDTAIARELIQHGADMTASAKYREPPVIEAASKGQTEIVEAMLDRGVDFARCGGVQELFVAAAQGGSVPLLKAFLARGANLNAPDRANSRLALSWAVRRPQAASFLLSQGADVNAKDRYGETALTDAAGWAEDSIWHEWREPFLVTRKTFQTLLAHGADVNAKTANGDTALIEATESGSVAFVKMLVEKGAIVDAKNEKNETALSIAMIEEDNARHWKRGRPKPYSRSLVRKLTAQHRRWEQIVTLLKQAKRPKPAPSAMVPGLYRLG